MDFDDIKTEIIKTSKKNICGGILFYITRFDRLQYIFNYEFFQGSFI